MTTTKDYVIEIVKKMPDTATLDDIMKQLQKNGDEMEGNGDLDGGIDVESITTLSEHALRPFLEHEPDIYTDDDLKVKYKRKGKSF